MTMTTIPKKMRESMALEPYYHVCARREALHDHECQRDPLNPRKDVEWEHALIYAGQKVQKRFAIVPLCWWAHRGPGENKEINVWIALNRASEAELLELSHKGGKDYFLTRSYLNRKYGRYEECGEPVNSTGINYGFPVEKSEVFHSDY